MRAAKIIQLVCWSLVAILLLSILIFNIVRSPSRSADGGRSWINTGSFEIFGSNWDLFDGDDNGGSGRYSVNDTYTIPVNIIKNISIDWISGEVDIVPHDGQDIVLSESASRELDEREKLVYVVSGDTLYVKMWEKQTGKLFNGRYNVGKNLTVRVPEEVASNLSELRVETVSSNVKASALKSVTSKLESVSGSMRFDDFESEELEASTVSGDIDINGTFTEIKAESISGSIEITDAVCPLRAEIGTISGKGKLTIPDNDGFTVKYEKVSGDFDCDFPITMAKNVATYKNGAATFKMTTVSGNLDINKLP